MRRDATQCAHLAASLQLSSPTLLLPNSPAPPTAPLPPPPPPSALSRIRSAVPSFGEQSGVGQTRTPVRGFWSVSSPLSFDNIGFSKDDTWVPPPLPVTSPPLASVDEEGGAKRKSKPVRRPSIFWSAEKKRAAAEEATAAAAAAAAAAKPKQPERAAQPDAPELSVKVKYLLCAECDCGPLGYVVLPEAMQGGGLAHAVGQQINARDAKAASVEQPVFLIAADRVRYRFLKT